MKRVSDFSVKEIPHPAPQDLSVAQSAIVRVRSRSNLARKSADRSPARSIVKRWVRCLPIVAFLFMSALGASPAAAQELMQRVLTVTGQGEAVIPATWAQVNVAVEAQGKTAEEVQAEVAQRSDAVVKLLKSRNVSKLKTTGINLSPTYDYNEGRQRLTGYQASNSVSFEFAADKTGALLDEVVKTGASRIDGVSFTASEEALDSAQAEALKDATQNAREQANAVLASLGLTAQEIVGIQISGASAPPIPVYARGQDSLKAVNESTTPVEAGEQTVNTSVTLQIRY